MCSLLLLGHGLWRSTDALNALAAAGVFMTAFAPSAPFELSVQLSFVAVAALILLVPSLRAVLPFSPPSRQRWNGWRWRILSLVGKRVDHFSSEPGGDAGHRSNSAQCFSPRESGGARCECGRFASVRAVDVAVCRWSGLVRRGTAIEHPGSLLRPGGPTVCSIRPGFFASAAGANIELSGPLLALSIAFWVGLRAPLRWPLGAGERWR